MATNQAIRMIEASGGDWEEAAQALRIEAEYHRGGEVGKTREIQLVTQF